MLLLSNAQIEQRLGISLSQLADLCQQWGIKESKDLTKSDLESSEMV